MSLLEVSGLSKTYTTQASAGAKVEALKSVTFSVRRAASTSPSWARAAAAKPRF